MKREATTMHDYLATLPPDRLAAISAVRYLVNRKLPNGYREAIRDGMIVWHVPLEVCSDTSNGQPLTYAALANEKKYMALYLMTVYSDPRTEAAFRGAFAKAGKRLDMGRACVRFRRVEDLHMPAIGRAVEACAMEDFVSRARAVREQAALAKARASTKAARQPRPRPGSARPPRSAKGR